MEAVASEVALLRQAHPGSVAWGLNPCRWILLSRRGFCLNPRMHLVFRAITKLLESTFDLHHVFGSLGDWFYLNRKRARPTILSVVAEDVPVERQLLEHVDRFVVEHPGAREVLEQLGFHRNRIELIFPPVNLDKFHPAPPPDGPFTVLFASSPPTEAWLDARGVPQLLEAAALRPQMRFRLLWRPWGKSERLVRQWIRERELRNVALEVGCWSDMAPHYQAAHVCAAPFTDLRRSKPAPNSVVEGLACGRPALVTEQVGLAEMVRDGGAGVVCPASGPGIAHALDQLEAEWTERSTAARRLAERWFGANRFLAQYRRVYDEVLGKCHAA